ncbi:endo alpha-1,4 polygalactosaminidase, partial [Streptomyces sp. NPDC057757]
MRHAVRPGAATALVLTLVAVLLAGCSADSPPKQGRWQPRPGTAWQWQLSGQIDTSVDVPVYDIDGFESSAAVVER